MLPPAEALRTILEQQLPGVAIESEQGILIVLPKDLIGVCRFLKDTDRFRMDYLANLTAVDHPPDRMNVVYHLYSMAHKHGPIALKITLDRQDPRVASVTPIWRGAEFQEREVFDLYGVAFEGHPDLRRILMWEGFEGHPMRKDYVPEDQNVPEEQSA